MTRFERNDTHRRAVALLDQQFWCWGQDVMRAAGNVLLELGMCRYRPVNGEGSTVYTGRVAKEGVVWLWGFGILYWQPNLGGVFLRRYRFDPVFVEQPLQHPIHTLDKIKQFTRSTASRQQSNAGSLMRAVIQWIAGYEHWIAENFGTTYRAATLASRNKLPAVPPQDLARTWERLAKKSYRLASSHRSSHGPWASILDSLQSRTTTSETSRKSSHAASFTKRIRIQ